ncbi:facilitated trehalose transporter Tret1-like [Belonocnema kinseyi]|uniref:facilitated trehalose transporter Tret1-like n=1 Tax=Belonocnema kinseyi TaxID=2817044 RepID=UPI00143D6E05|nr:facilitated trehalose transporter Tret1-like [Belonocnema kinseyi]
MKGNGKVLIRYGTAITATAYTVGGFGCIVSWTSPALEHFKNNSTDFRMTTDEISWIAPLLPIGFIIGYLIIPMIINRFDRKWILVFLALPQIASYILIVLAKDIISIYVARILGGIGYGSGSSALVVFLSEIATQETRGIFLSFHKMFFSLGIFFIMFLSTYLPYYYLNFTIIATMSFFALAFIFMPGSNYFREENEREEEMNMMLKLSEKGKISNLKNDISKETSGIKNDTIEKVSFNFKIKESSFWKLVTVRANQRALIIVILSASQDVLSGHTIVRYFSHQIFTYNESFLTPAKSSLFLASIKITSAFICTQVIERVDRKVILFNTLFLGSLGMGIIGLFFFLECFKVDVSYFLWMPIFGICLYEFMLTMGIGNFVNIYLGELFPHNLRGLAITICKVTSEILSFFSILMYQIMIGLVNTCVIFWIFAATNIILGLIILKITPETKGKSEEEIQILLNAK